MKLKWIILAIVAVFLAVLIGLPIYAHYRLKNRVANYRAELRQRGEKTTLDEVIPPAPTNGPNGAMQFVTAAGQLNAEGFFITDISPMRRVAPGKARVAWQQERLMSNKTNLWPLMTGAMASNQLALADLRTALSNPVVRFNINYRDGFNALLPHLAPVKNAAQWLSSAVVFDLHEERVERAHENLMALAAARNSLAEERFLISHLVRIATAQIAVGVFWEALQHPDFTEAQLAAWQAAWADTNAFKYAENADQMESVLQEQTFKELRRNPALANATWGAASSSTGFDNLKEKFYLHVLWPRWLSYEDEYRALRHWQGNIEAARMAQSNHVWAEVVAHLETVRKQIKAECPSPSVIDWFGDDYGLNFLSKFATFESARRLLVTAIALQRYKLRHGKFPEKLAALVPEFLPAEPRDFMDGQPLRYRLNADGTYLLYSVGEDGKDDGGDGTAPDEKSSPARYWLRGRDWVWPRPASKEEIEADDAKRAK